MIVGETAVVKGTVRVHSIIVNGLVEGEIQAKARIEIHATGRVFGNLLTPSLSVNEGAVFEGYCKMVGATDKGKEEVSGFADRTVDIPHPPHVLSGTESHG